MTDHKFSRAKVQQLMKNFSTKLNMENHNMEVELAAATEEMVVDQALEELLNKWRNQQVVCVCPKIKCSKLVNIQKPIQKFKEKIHDSWMKKICKC